MRPIQFFTAAAVMAASLAIHSPANAQQREPVYRVDKVAKADPKANAVAHPLDLALDRAREGLVRIRKGDPARGIEPVRDYTCYLVKRERINGELTETNTMFCKIRQEHVDPKTGRTVPFSVYMKFVKPTAIKGREVVWVKGRNGGKLCAHEGGNSWLPTVWLKPDGALAMKGQLYPISEAGLESLVIKLIERGTAERRYPANECKVTFQKGVRINKRPCTLLTVSHPVKRPEYEFSFAQIFIDDELELPVRYVAYDWPKPGETRGEIQEEYTHLQIKLNVGLTDKDFDPKNPEYDF